MHELSIAQSIVQIAQEQLVSQPHREIKSIELEIGSMSGVMLDALNFVWDSAVKNTVLENAEKYIQFIPAKCRCGNCQLEYEVQFATDPCPKCGEIFNELLCGKELRVKSITLRFKII